MPEGVSHFFLEKLKKIQLLRSITIILLEDDTQQTLPFIK
jgi:hypothetical protein